MSTTLTHDLIKSFDNLNSNMEINSVYYNPIIGLITPEWHFSNSFKIYFNEFNDIFKDQYFRQNINNLNKYKEDEEDDAFEMTLSSWYIPFHYKPRDKWGIHLRIDKLIGMMKKFNNIDHFFESSEQIIQASTLYFILHEIFHYIVEYNATLIEITNQNPLLYKQYLISIYETKFLTADDCIEESIANAYLYSQWRQLNFPENILFELLSKQPKSYKNFVNYIGKNFQHGIKKLIAQLSNSNTFKNTMIIIDSNTIKFHEIPLWIHFFPLPLNKN
jgi:hypothetical protein